MDNIPVSPNDRHGASYRARMNLDGAAPMGQNDLSAVYGFTDTLNTGMHPMRLTPEDIVLAYAMMDMPGARIKVSPSNGDDISVFAAELPPLTAAEFAIVFTDADDPDLTPEWCTVYAVFLRNGEDATPLFKVVDVIGGSIGMPFVSSTFTFFNIGLYVYIYDSASSEVIGSSIHDSNHPLVVTCAPSHGNNVVFHFAALDIDDDEFPNTLYVIDTGNPRACYGFDFNFEIPDVADGDGQLSCVRYNGQVHARYDNTIYRFGLDRLRDDVRVWVFPIDLAQ